MNKVILILVFFLNSGCLLATGKDSLKVATDSSRVIPKQFSGNLAEKYAGSEFDYDSLDGEAENFLGRAINWFLNMLQSVFGIQISPELYQILKILVYGLLIAFACYVLIKFLLGDAASSFFGRKSNTVAPLAIQEEHIENIDLDNYIKNALKEENYRLAIRYMYLKSLKSLSLQNLIEWHFEKTNTDYYREIQNLKVKEYFKKASYLYDNIWYGEFVLDKTGFENALTIFEQLNQNLKNAG